MKYIIDIPENGQCQYRYNEDTKELKFPYIRLDPNMGLDITITISGVTPYTEPDRKAIEDEVWAFAKNIGSFNGLAKRDLDECFGHTTIQGVMTTYDTYREAKAKYEAWKKQKDEVRVGDEVEYFCGGNTRFVVCGIDNGVAYGFKYRPDFEDLDIGEYCEIDELKKTGRHFDEIEELLKKMREG